MDAATKERLRQGAIALGVPLDDSVLAKLQRYLELLLQWNRRINLTAITDPRQIVERHFLDSIAVAPLLGSARTLVDIGSGAGFPGAVLAVLRPELAVTSVDSVRKKIAFQEALRMELAPNLSPIAGRHDELVRAGRTFDVSVSRATWDPSEWVQQGAPLVAPGGLLVAMRTADQGSPSAPAGLVAEPPITYSVEGMPRYLVPFRRTT